MFKRGPLLITGTSVAMLLSAASYAAPINNAQNTQVSEAGEESTADTTVNLDQTDDGVALATAQGNSATGDFYEETAFVSAQSQAGRTAASATANAHNVYGALNANAVAQANTASLTHEGVLDVEAEQTATGPEVSTNALLRLDNANPAAYTGDLTSVAQGTANALDTHGYGALTLDSSQSSTTAVTSTARTDVNSVTSRTATASATSAGNSQSARTYGGDGDVRLDQTNTGAVQSVSDVDHEGDAEWGATSAAQAVGNTAQVLNDDGAIRIDGSQLNSGGVSASATLAVNSHDQGLALGTSNAVGNTSLASAFGGEVYTGVTQNNSGNVTATTQVNAGSGQGVMGASSAMGNAQSAYVCASCPVSNSGTINQTNSGTIRARTTVNANGYNPYVTGSATAVGNAATFSTRDPAQ